jgi:glycerol-3-phosphate dehydrogenase
MIRASLFLYDHLARRELLPGSASRRLAGSVYGAPLRPEFTRGFVYSDGWVDDARLVVANAQDARRHGAEVLTRCAVTQATRTAVGWQVALATGRQVRARAMVNAAGPWAESFLRGQGLPARGLRLVKGSHIVVDQRFTHDHAYIFQNPDGRIVFAIPYQGRFTLIGTTDVELPHDTPPPDLAAISAAETDYLCEQASRYLARPVTPADVRWTYAGVRPLLDEGGSASSVTRDYLLEADAGDGRAPLLNVWGGKLTTYRKLAEDGASQVGRLLGDARRPWTATARLPGGDLGPHGVDIAAFTAALQARHPGHPAARVARLALAYGSVATELLAAPAGAEVAPGLFERELRHLVDEEWAHSADDVLWRRSKLGLHYTEAQRAAVAAWFGN